MTRRAQSGFSVIEALAALAIIAIALIPLMSLQIQVSRGYIQQRDQRADLMAQRNSLAILRDLNIMESPSGVRALDPETTMSWSAAPISPLTRNTRQGAGEGEFEVGLFRVRVSLTRSGASPSAFSVEQLGWRPASQDERP